MDRLSLLKRNEKILYISQFFHSLIFTIPVLFLFLQQRFSATEIAYVVAFASAIQLLSELPTGALADLLGRKKVIILGYAIGAAGILLIPFATTFILLLIAYACYGVSESLLSGALEAMTYDSLKEQGREAEVKEVAGKNSSLYQVGLMIGTISGGFLFAIAGWLPFIVYGISIIGAALLSFLYIEPNIDSEKFTLPNYLRQIKEGFKEMSKTRQALLISLFYIIVGAITWSSTLYFTDMVIIEIGFTAIEIAIFYSIVRFLNVGATRYIWSNNKIFTRKRSFWFFPIAMVFCYLPAIFFTKYTAIPFIAGLIGLTTARYVMLSQYPNELFSSKNRASAISSLSMCINILYLAFVFISSFLVPTVTNFRGIFTGFGIISLIVLSFLAIIINKEN